MFSWLSVPAEKQAGMQANWRSPAIRGAGSLTSQPHLVHAAESGVQPSHACKVASAVSPCGGQRPRLHCKVPAVQVQAGSLCGSHRVSHLAAQHLEPAAGSLGGHVGCRESRWGSCKKAGCNVA
jgi:hypothetical protein